MAAPKRAFWLLLAPFGILIYLFLNWWVVGDPLAFLEYEKGDPWFHESVLPWEWLADLLRGMINEPAGPAKSMTYEMPLASFLLAVTLLVIGVRWLRLSYQVFAWCGLIMLMFLTMQFSMLRYVMALFPIFFVLARIGSRPALHQALIAASVIAMGGFWVLFATEYWGI
jgi:hypothetical protein